MYSLLRSESDISNIQIHPNKKLFCDTETCEDEGRTDGGLYGQIRIVQLYQEHWNEALILDCFYLPLQGVLDLIQPFSLVFHNASYDLHTINLYTDEVWLPAEVNDTSYLARLMYYTRQRFTFYNCLDYAGVSDKLIKGIDKKEAQKSDWSGPLSEKQKTYAACDVVYLHKLYEAIKEKSNSMPYRLDIKNLEYAVKYTRNGIPTNRDTVKNFKQEYINKLEPLLDKLPINPRSHVQCKKYLGTSSSKAEILTNLVDEGNEKAKDIQDARHYYKSLEYLNSYDRPIVKGFFNPSAALSGRFSCSGGHSFDHVNLQQPPRKLRKVFEALEGWVFVYKDYSGIELRTAAAFTGEPTMCKMFREGLDLHAETSKYIFSIDDYTDQQRDIAKEFNFLLIYGGGIPLAKAKLKENAKISMSFQGVKELVTSWFDLYAGFKEWHSLHKHNFDIYGYMDVQTALGRLVRTYRLTDSLNLPIQGTASEVQKTALGMLFENNPNAPLVNTMHDDNILLCKEEDAERWGDILDKCMVDAWHYVIADLTDPDIPMPTGYKVNKVWDFE